MGVRFVSAHRFQGDCFHICHHQRGCDARRVQGVRRGRDRDVHVRHHAPAPWTIHPKLGAGRQGLGMGRLLGQHRLWVQVRQTVRGHGRTRPQSPREDELTQQRGRQNGEIIILYYCSKFYCCKYYYYYRVHHAS